MRIRTHQARPQRRAFNDTPPWAVPAEAFLDAGRDNNLTGPSPHELRAPGWDMLFTAFEISPRAESRTRRGIECPYSVLDNERARV